MGGKNQNAQDTNLFDIFFHRIASLTAGTNLDYAGDSSSRGKLVSLSFLLTTDATVADRRVDLIIEKGGVDYYISGAGAVQPATKALRYYFMVGGSLSDIPNPVIYHVPLPDSPLIYFADSIKTEIQNIQAGDQLTEITLILQKQPTPRQF